jgi:hypothetical protein
MPAIHHLSLDRVAESTSMLENLASHRWSFPKLSQTEFMPAIHHLSLDRVAESTSMLENLASHRWSFPKLSQTAVGTAPVQSAGRGPITLMQT